MQLTLPAQGANMMFIFQVFKENMQKFNRFTSTVLNPSSLAELITKFGKIEIKPN